MAMSPIVYVVTCGQCGQNWQCRNVADSQHLDCIFCGLRGRLSVGPLPASETQRAEAWLMR